jgi:cytochrome c
MLKKTVLFIAALAFAGAMLVAQQPRYKIGRAATAEEIRPHDISIAPDGGGLPSGHGTAADGRFLYRAKCASCHGSHGQGTADFPALAGGEGTLATNKPIATVGSYWPYASTVWDYVNRAMPYQSPGSLKPNEVYALTAYLLYINNIIGEYDEMNQETLPKVRMPNRNGFIPDSRPDVK